SFLTTPTAYDISPVLGSWVWTNLTWNTQPPLYDDFVEGTGVRDQWASRDITTWVQNWADGAWANNGLEIDTGGVLDQSYWKKLTSDENTNDQQVSYLQVTYNTRPPMTTAVTPA